jgi:hypothetical protein
MLWTKVSIPWIYVSYPWQKSEGIVLTFTPKSIDHTYTTISHLSFQTAHKYGYHCSTLFCKVWDGFIEVIYWLAYVRYISPWYTFRRCVTIANCTTTNSLQVHCKILRNYRNPCILARLLRNIHVATEPIVIANFTPVALWHLTKQRVSCAIFVGDSLWFVAWRLMVVCVNSMA